ncbi:hypothetical protein PC128_g22434 [Phytophthora cactorum]|nr:hypothetical protein PC128_g22434 [Phytophthora cactorum]
MGKPNGSANYSLPEMHHMQDIVKRILPQGKYHWDTVTARYNATRENNWPERDIDSLRRKYKALYGTRKPTDNPNIPGHARLTKAMKKLIDDASSVFLASDAEGESEEDVIDFRVSRGGRSDRSGTSSGESAELYAGGDRGDESDAADEDFNQLDPPVHPYTDSTESGPAQSSPPPPLRAYQSGGASPHFTRSSEEIPGGGTDLSGLELAEASNVVAATSPLLANEEVTDSEEVVLRRSRRNKSKPAPAIRPPPKTAKAGKAISASSGSLATVSAGAREKLRYPGLAGSSDGLGGVNLAAMRDASKMRTYNEFEEESYTKQKRIKAEKAAADLKRKLACATQGSADSSSELVKTIMVLRANTDREDRARGGSRGQASCRTRRREERREERKAAEERRRIDRDESRAHMREMMMMLPAIQNAKAPSVDI